MFLFQRFSIAVYVYIPWLDLGGQWKGFQNYYHAGVRQLSPGAGFDVQNLLYSKQIGLYSDVHFVSPLHTIPQLVALDSNRWVCTFRWFIHTLKIRIYVQEISSPTNSN